MDEPLDRNKTDLTHNITAMAIAYLQSRGFRPTETEVAVEKGWIADIAGFGCLAEYELKKLHVLGKRQFIPPIDRVEEYYLRYGNLLTAIVEVKTSRSDFTGDWKFKTKLYPANLCFIAYPKGLVKEMELPEGWLGLEINLDGNNYLRFTKNHTNPYNFHHAQHPGQVIDFISKIAVKLEYRQRFLRNRTWAKMYRAGRESEYNNRKPQK